MSVTVYSSYEAAQANAVVVRDHVYRGVRVVVTDVPAVEDTTQGRFVSRRAAHLELKLDGRRVTCPKGDVETVVKKVHAGIDEDVANAELLPQLQAVIHNADQDELVELTNPQVGDVAYVYAMGRTRRGLVTKVTKTRVEVAYTTASNPTRVFRKATAQDGLQTDAPEAQDELQGEELAEATALYEAGHTGVPAADNELADLKADLELAVANCDTKTAAELRAEIADQEKLLEAAETPDQNEGDEAKADNEVDELVAQTLRFGPDLPTTFAGAIRGLVDATPGVVVQLTVQDDKGETTSYDVAARRVTSDSELVAHGWQHRADDGGEYLVTVRWDAERDVEVSRAVELVPLDSIVDVLVY